MSKGFKTIEQYKLTITGGVMSGGPVKISDAQEVSNQLRIYVTGSDVVFNLSSEPRAASATAGTDSKMAQGNTVHPAGDIEMYSPAGFGALYIHAAALDGASDAVVYITTGYGAFS